MTIGNIHKLIETYKENFRLCTGHELTCTWTEGRSYELDELANLVQECLNADPRELTRKHHVVDARTVFCIIAREMNYMTVEIGKFLGQDHTSVVHLTKNKIMKDRTKQKLYKFREYMMNPVTEL